MRRILLTIPSLTLILGSLFCETRILSYLIVSYNWRYSSWIEEAFFYVCTVMQLVSLIMYLMMHPLKHYSHCNQFIFLPLFAISFIKQIMPFSSDPIINPLRISFFLVGWVVSLIMAMNQYTRYPEDQSETLVKISTNLRIFKLVKKLLLAVLAGFNLIQSVQVVFIFMLGFTFIQCYCFISSFTFQNPFHQYLLMMSTFSSFISWIDFILFYQGITSYSFIGEILFILTILFNPQIFQRVLQMKYQLYGQKNIQTRKIGELLGVLVVMKEIVLNQSQSLRYTEQFSNKMFTLLQKMVAKNKILFQSFDQSNMLKEKDYLSEDQISFLKVLQKRLKQNQQFIAHEFYLTTIVRKGFNFKNKALAIYYQRVTDNGLTSTNRFNKIQMKMLYHHLMNQLQQKGRNQVYHAVLTFSQSLNQLKNKIKILCKRQISVVNLFQNSSNVPIQRYSGELIQRHQIKLQIKKKIDELITNDCHIQSGSFLYICLLYKIIFEREQIIIGEKINKNFVIPLAYQSRKSKFLIQQNRRISIFVYSTKQKGLILNENEYFSKTYGRTVRTAQKSKKYVSQLFLSLKQRTKHQDLMQSSTKYQSLSTSDHSNYDCWIRRRIVLKNDKFHDQQRMISVVEKVKISARLYYEDQQAESYICTICQLQSGIESKFLAKDVELLKKYEIRFQIVGKQTLQQLDQKFEIFSIINKSYDDSFIEDQISEQQSEANISQNLMFPLNFESIEHKKIQKIEKQYDKEQIQFDPRRLSILFLILLPILSLLVNIFISAKIDSQITQAKQVMQYEKMIFAKTLISEKYVGLNLMLYQMVNNNNISNTMCQSYGVNSIQQYAVQNLLQFADNNFDQIEITQIQGVKGDDQLQQIFNSNYYQFFEFKDQNIWMNYVMYGSLTKSSIYEYAILDGGAAFNQWSSIAIAKAINVSQLSYDGLYSHLRMKFSQIKKNLQQSISNSLIILYIVEIFIFIVVLIAFYRLIGYKYNHILLLRDFKKNYVKGRVRQMDFILTEMVRLEKNQIYDIQIDKLMNLQMTRQNKQQSFTIEQLQKQSLTKSVHQKTLQDSTKSMSFASSANHLQEQKQYLVEGNQTLKQRNQTAPIMIMFSFHKYKVLGLLVFFIISGTLNVLQNKLLTEKTTKIFLMEDLFNDMGLLLIAMEDLLVGEVVKYKGQQVYASHDLNELWIALDIQQLMYNKFQQKTYQLFPKNIEDLILYQSYCHRAKNISVCQSFKSGVLKNGLSSLIGMIRKDYNSTWDHAYSSDIIRQQQICQRLVIYINFTINQYQANLVQGYQNIQNGLNTQQNQLKIADGIVSIFLILGIGIVAEIIVARGRKVRAEVLSMDTKINLYKQHQSYRTLLNTLYYKEEKDVSF